jgi:hypothetical protein
METKRLFLRKKEKNGGGEFQFVLTTTLNSVLFITKFWLNSLRN